MCGRFTINTNKQELTEVFSIDDTQLPAFEAMDNIPPSTHIPIVQQTVDKRELKNAYWGLIPSWAKDRSFSGNTFNARSETLSEKPSFRHAYKKQHCLIPCTEYYEWANIRVNGKLAGKQQFGFRHKNNQPFAFAGLYENWTDTNTGESIRSCTIITREAYASINHIHHRMPVILPSDAYQAWLDATANDFPMIAEDKIEFYPIKDRLGPKSNNYEFNF